MSLNPLAPVTDYQSMLNRIAWFSAASALAATWLLRLYIPALDVMLSKVDAALTLGGDKALPTSAGFLLPALAVGVATRVFRLHARISDWLGIRECFDVEVILGELASQLDIDLEPVGNESLRKARHRIMRKAFYPYVSGSPPQIDQQLIHQALDAWSWLWVGVEATVLFALTAFGLVASGAYEVGLQLLGGVIVLAIVCLPAIRRQCRRYAIAQVRAILADPARTAAVRAAFAELTGESGKVRMAA